MKPRENPFRASRVDALRYRSPEFSWDRLEADLEARNGRGALVGGEGTGKTTLLREWAARRGRAGDEVVELRIAFRQRRLAAAQRAEIRAGAWLFVDGGEQLGVFGWAELRWQARGCPVLIATLHAPGRLATLWRATTSPALLAELCRDLGGTDVTMDAIWHRHRGNLRLALRELYDLAAGDRSGFTSA